MNKKVLALLSLILMTTLAANVLAVQPFGANYTEINSTRAPIDLAADNEALAGNVTELSVTGYSITQTWQGYFGNVSGTIQLADGSDNVMYNWSLASPEGEIYATTDIDVTWANIACFNLSANHSNMETTFNITSDDVDGINETFSDAGTHDMFYTNNVQFTAGQCASTSIYDSTGASVDNNFEEVLLTDAAAAGDQIIFAAILDEADTLGFDNAYHDFEMLVLDDGHGTNTATTTYYFYVELE